MPFFLEVGQVIEEYGFCIKNIHLPSALDKVEDLSCDDMTPKCRFKVLEQGFYPFDTDTGDIAMQFQGYKLENIETGEIIFLTKEKAENQYRLFTED